VPRFYDIRDAIDSGGPFTLADSAEIKLEEVSQDKWYLIHDALLRSTSLEWINRNEEDLLFIAGVIRDHTQLKNMTIEFRLEGEHEKAINDLGLAVQSSKAHQLCIRRDTHIRQPIADWPQGVNIDKFLKSLQHAHNLKELDIAFHPKPHDHEGIGCAIQNQQLVSFTISSFYILPELWAHLTPTLSTHKSLRHLDLWSLGEVGSLAVGEILRNNTVLTTLSSSEDNTVEVLSNILAGLKVNTTVQSVAFRGNEEGAIKLLSATLAQNEINVQSLELFFAELSNEECRLLGEALQLNTRLTSLAMSHCHLDDDNMSLLSRGLAVNTTLKSLNFNSNPFEAAGTKALTDALKLSNSLTSLDLSSQERLGEVEPCKYLAELIERTTSLRTLKLSDTGITDQGLTIICAAVGKNKTIHSLDLRSNYYEQDGLRAVKHTLTSNSTLQHLSLDLRYRSNESLEIVCEGLKNNSSLRKIVLNKWFVIDRDEEQRMIAEVLEHNYALESIVHQQSSTIVTDLLARNKRIKSETQFKVAILSHNIAQSHEAMSTLPREIWKSILSTITHPGMEAFTELVENIFNLYNN
jgi:hypothetical protein